MRMTAIFQNIGKVSPWVISGFRREVHI